MNLLPRMIQTQSYKVSVRPDRDILELLLADFPQADRRKISH